MSSPEHITDGKMHLKNMFMCYVEACVTQTRTTIDLYRLSVTEQSNYVLKKVVIAYEIYPHCHNYPKREAVLIRCLFMISQDCLIDLRHFYYIPTYKYITRKLKSVASTKHCTIKGATKRLSMSDNLRTRLNNISFSQLCCSTFYANIY